MFQFDCVWHLPDDTQEAVNVWQWMYDKHYGR